MVELDYGAVAASGVVWGRKKADIVTRPGRRPTGLALDEWLESLSPFWTVFALTLTETVGAGILALPIALAGVGPLPGVVILVVLGVVNVLTIAGLAEAVAGSESLGRDDVFIGRIVASYVGRCGSLIVSIALVAECVLTLWPYYIGLSTTLADATRLPAPAWLVVVFLVGLYFLRRKTLNATIASALVVGAINVGLILVLAVLALPHIRPANLLYANVPFLGGRPFDPSILKLMFGVVLLAYFGHVSVSNCAHVVLQRDPSARSLVRGAAAAQVVVITLYCLWTLVVNGAIAPQALAGQPGTVLAPLAAEIGPIVHVLGSVFVVLGMGMGTIHSSLPLLNLVRERLPTGPDAVAKPPRWRRALLLGERGRYLVSICPVLMVFVLVEWMLLTGKGSFVEPLGFLGVIVISLLGGIFPVLLLVSSRRQGKALPGGTWRALGHRSLTVGIFVLYLVSVFLHGLVIWENPVQRAVAMGVGVMIVGVTLVQVGRGCAVGRVSAGRRSRVAGGGLGMAEAGG